MWKMWHAICDKYALSLPFSFKLSLNLGNPDDDLRLDNSKETNAEKEHLENFDDVIVTYDFLGDISKHRQATVYEIDVEIRLESTRSIRLLLICIFMQNNYCFCEID